MTLTYKLDLDILPLDLHAQIQVSMSVLSAVRVVTDTHTQGFTDTQTDDVKTITPNTSQTCGLTIWHLWKVGLLCKNGKIDHV